MRVVIVGAGVSGLATARFLQAEGVQVSVLEARDSPGGNVRSVREEGRVLDVAANGWLNSEPAMTELLQLAGLTERLIPASDQYDDRFIFADGSMQPAPMSPPAMLRSRLISTWAKLRLLLEPFIGRATGPETVAEFVRRRLGQAFVDRMVGPMVAGVYASAPEQLSLEAAFPRMAELEREHRSLFLAMMRLRRGGAPRGHLQTLDGGAGSLPEALAQGLDLQLGVSVHGLEPQAQGFRVLTADGSVEADAVVLACPGHAQAPLVGFDPLAVAALERIRYAPVAVVASAWSREAWERRPEGFGVLVAAHEPVGVLGCLFTSCIFPDQAPDDEVLLRTIIGGAVEPEAAREDDPSLRARCDRAHGAFFGRQLEPPRMMRIFRHPRGIPQYEPGHLDRVGVLRQAEGRHPGLVFTGNHLQGIGVKDCARAGKEAAAKVLSAFAAPGSP